MTRILSRAALLLLAVTLSTAALAKTRSATAILSQDASLNGTTIPAGEYVVKYDIDGPTAQVKFLKGSKEVASASGQVKTLDKKVGASQIFYNTDGKVPSIAEMDFGGQTSAITFENVSASAGK